MAMNFQAQVSDDDVSCWEARGPGSARYAACWKPGCRCMAMSFQKRAIHWGRRAWAWAVDFNKEFHQRCPALREIAKTGAKT